MLSWFRLVFADINDVVISRTLLHFFCIFSAFFLASFLPALLFVFPTLLLL